jgi:3-hydroxyacyl-[acyl-carrier-protein] dehydratase
MIDTEGILQMLPHRFPFLMIDRVLEIDEELTHCRAMKNVTANEPQFTGHFPGKPVMPGVLILEAMAQTCCILAMKRLPPELAAENKIFYFAGIDGVRFKKVVTPGDQLVFDAVFVRERGGIGWYECKATVDGAVACSATMMCARR